MDRIASIGLLLESLSAELGTPETAVVRRVAEFVGGHGRMVCCQSENGRCWDVASMSGSPGKGKVLESINIVGKIAAFGQHRAFGQFKPGKENFSMTKTLSIATSVVVLATSAALADPGKNESGKRRGGDRDCQGIPCGQLPPPGQCRAWLPGVPSGQQPPPGDCRELEINAPREAIIIRG